MQVTDFEFGQPGMRVLATVEATHGIRFNRLGGRWKDAGFGSPLDAPLLLRGEGPVRLELALFAPDQQEPRTRYVTVTIQADAEQRPRKDNRLNHVETKMR